MQNSKMLSWTQPGPGYYLTCQTRTRLGHTNWTNTDVGYRFSVNVFPLLSTETAWLTDSVVIHLKVHFLPKWQMANTTR